MPAIPPSRQPFDLFGPAPTSRMTFAPFGTYADPDGSEHLDFAVPSMITEPINALSRLAQNSITSDGHLGIPDPQNLDNQHDVNSVLLSLYGGNAMNPGRLLEGAAGHALPDIPAAASGGPMSFRGYRGATAGDDLFHPNDTPLFMASHPDVAATYAGDVFGDGNWSRDTGSIAPLDVAFQNPMVVDAQGSHWSQIPFDGGTKSTDALATTARGAGHDGLVIRNVRDSAGNGGLPADTYAALGPGTVTSPLTGETLFSDTGKPSLMGSALAGAEHQNALATPRQAAPFQEIPQIWGPKWDIAMGKQYQIADAGGDLSTMYDILAGKLNKAGDLTPEMRQGITEKLRELHEQMGPDGRRMAGIPDQSLYSDQMPSLFGGLSQDQNNQLPPRNALLNY